MKETRLNDIGSLNLVVAEKRDARGTIRNVYNSNVPRWDKSVILIMQGDYTSVGASLWGTVRDLSR